jgi:hypothetical protein
MISPISNNVIYPTSKVGSMITTIVSEPLYTITFAKKLPTQCYMDRWSHKLLTLNQTVEAIIEKTAILFLEAHSKCSYF